MSGMAEKEQSPDQPAPDQAQLPPPLPPYAPDPRLIDLMERGADMTDEDVRRELRRYGDRDSRTRS